jgi:hypothetical protein
VNLRVSFSFLFRTSKKIPYSKSHVSMAVHRVGRTLLLDELALHEFFSGTVRQPVERKPV